MSRDRAATSVSSEGGHAILYRLEAGEAEWEIAPGRTVRSYGLNGQVSGPILEAKQRVPLEIEFTNRLPLSQQPAILRPVAGERDAADDVSDGTIPARAPWYGD